MLCYGHSCYILAFQPILWNKYFPPEPANTATHSPKSISEGGRIWQVWWYSRRARTTAPWRPGTCGLSGRCYYYILAIFFPFSQFCEVNVSLLSLQTQPDTAPNLFQRGVEYGKYVLSYIYIYIIYYWTIFIYIYIYIYMYVSIIIYIYNTMFSLSLLDLRTLRPLLLF